MFLQPDISEVARADRRSIVGDHCCDKAGPLHGEHISFPVRESARRGFMGLSWGICGEKEAVRCPKGAIPEGRWKFYPFGRSIQHIST